MIKCLKQCAIALAIGAFAGQAHAGLIFDNGSPNQFSGNEMTGVIQAENFSLATAATVTDVRFWDVELLNVNTYTGSITWFIYANNAGVPGAVIATGSTSTVSHVNTGITAASGNLNEYVDNFSIGSVALLANTTYWLGLHNGPVTHTSFDGMYWETTGTGNAPSGEGFPLPSGPWASNGFEHAFQLFSNPAAVPEPSTLALCGVAGLLGLGYRWRSRQSV